MFWITRNHRQKFLSNLQRISQERIHFVLLTKIKKTKCKHTCLFTEKKLCFCWKNFKNSLETIKIEFTADCSNFRFKEKFLAAERKFYLSEIVKKQNWCKNQ